MVAAACQIGSSYYHSLEHDVTGLFCRSFSIDPVHREPEAPGLA